MPFFLPHAAIEYRAPASCPTEAEFLAGVKARVRDGAEPSGRVTLEVDEVAGRFHGLLVVGDARREVTGASCAEVVGALGLVLALAIDTEAAAETAPPPAPPPPPPLTPPPPPSERRAPVPPRPREGIAFAAGVGGGVSAGIAPAAMFAPGAFVEASLPARVVLRLSATRAASGAFDVPGAGSARLVWTAGALDACPIRFAWRSSAFAPCLRIGAGVLAGSGDGVAHPKDDARLWLDAGALVRAEIGLAGPIFVDLEGGATVPLTRPRFHFDVPDTTIREPDAIVPLAAAYAGVRFP